MKIFKTASDRLVRYFEKSRDAWKARALQKQQQLRALEIKVRDLSVSRDYWKKKAKEAEKSQRETSKKSFLREQVSSTKRMKITYILLKRALT